MKTTHRRAATALAIITAGITTTAITFAGAGAALATNPPTHVGDPAVWGPPLEALCDDPIAGPIAAAVLGYNVIVDDTTGGPVAGTDQADAIFAAGGNDIVHAGAGDDVLCLSFGNDDAFGEGGNDAIFGQGHADDLKGGGNRDFLAGGGQHDRCDGGNGDDVADVSCETIAA